MEYPLEDMSSVPDNSGKTNVLLQAQINNRRANERAIIENPLGTFNLPQSVGKGVTGEESMDVDGDVDERRRGERRSNDGLQMARPASHGIVR